MTQAAIDGDNTAVNTNGTYMTVTEGTTGVTQNGTTFNSVTSTPSGGGDYSYTTTVSNLSELQAALSNSSVSEITIRGSISIPIWNRGCF